MAKKKGAEYISGKESRAITKENRRVTDVIEKKRNRKHIPEAEYISKMKNPDNVVEFDDVTLVVDDVFSHNTLSYNSPRKEIHNH